MRRETKGESMKIKGQKIDWSKSDAEISRLLNVSPSTITRQRKKRGIGAANPHKRVETDWRKLPWETLNDSQIAESLGCSRSLITTRRREYAKHLQRPRHISFCWQGQNWNLTNEEIAKERGITVGSVSTARTRHAKGVKAPRKMGKKQQREAMIQAKLCERKTVHEWLNNLAIPVKENGNDIGLLRRLRIALDELYEFKTWM
jgi:DNA-binding CsgD family transcriptional regulator